MIFSLLNNNQRKHLEQNWELDCSYGLKGVARFRVNVYREKVATPPACLRALGSSIPSLEQLGLPDVVREISERPRGLVLVTGPTGSGKTTTLAALLNHINQQRAEHILTVEDPIEFVYQSARSVIHQRELGEDTRSFANALKAALREDPDVILVGEMRDLETIQLAITAAETGHLVFGTLHTSSAAQTVDRMVDVFPPEQQTQIRVQLSGSLVAVFAQTLCRRLNPPPGAFGRVMAQEIMVNTPAMANLIREGQNRPDLFAAANRRPIRHANPRTRPGQPGRAAKWSGAKPSAKPANPMNWMRLPVRRDGHPSLHCHLQRPSRQREKPQAQGRRSGQRQAQPAPARHLGLSLKADSGSSEKVQRGLSLSLEKAPGVKEKAVFASQMAALVSAGVPIVRSLEILAEQQKLPMFKRALQRLSLDVNQGSSLGAALRRWPQVFDALSVAMVEAGEAGGVLEEVLKRLAKLLEDNAKLQNQIRGALGYQSRCW